MKYYNKGIGLDTLNTDGLYRRINYYSQLEEYDLAMNDIKKVRELDPASPESYFKESIINSKLGKYKSLINIEKAIEIYIKWKNDEKFAEKEIYLDYRSFVSETVKLHDLYLFRAELYKKYDELDEYCIDLNNAINSFEGNKIEIKEKIQNLLTEFCN